MNFNQEEKRKIRKVYKTVLKDLELILKDAKSKKINISCSLGHNEVFQAVFGFYYCDCFIEIDDADMRVVTRYESLGTTSDIAVLATVSKNGCVIPRYSNYLLCGAFIKEYPKIRDKIIKEIKTENKKIIASEQKKLDLKESILNDLPSIQNRYSKTADVQIDLPPSQNQHRLVVKKENGRNVGIIDFGNSTIRLITDGQITLVKEQEKDVKDLKKR